MKIKVGILSEYYSSTNYGGNLQAYALTRYINENYGYAEQIQYKKPDYNYHESIFDKIKKYKFNIILKLTKKIKKEILKRTLEKKELLKLRERSEAIRQFNNSIPHSKKVYTDDTMIECKELYDIFICGSDQVWREIGNKAYFLDFVGNEKTKVAYAASISKNTLSDDEKRQMQIYLSEFNAISVREEDAVELLKNIGIESMLVLDPTFLLSKEQWEDVCTPRKIIEPYIFCYFLGDGVKARRLAMEYASQKKCKVITMPYLLNDFRECDWRFGEFRDYNSSPADFLSLIKYSECVFTDSFHATIFSNIFKKEFFVFERPTKNTMSSRIYNLLRILEKEERFCDTNEKLNLIYIMGRDRLEYNKNNMVFNELLNNSKLFLKCNLI